MIIKDPKFEISAVSPKQYPKNNLPEIVLVGKSNVGKSSFINTMINFIEYYLQHREQITLVIFLVDIRHSPTANDKLMYDYIIRAGLPCLILANKADKIAITKVDTEVKKIQQFLNPMLDITTLPFSSERKNYSEAVWDFLENFNS